MDIAVGHLQPGMPKFPLQADHIAAVYQILGCGRVA